MTRQAVPQPAAPALAAPSADALLGLGVPSGLLQGVLAATEDGFLALASQLPAEALLDYATCGEAGVAADDPRQFGHAAGSASALDASPSLPNDAV